jgi:phosphate starvation-inducible membrane PsiE
VVLGAEARTIRGPELGAFGTPTIVHFCAVLLMAAILTVPWRAVPNAGLALSASGVAGIAYMLVVINRARRQKAYAPVLEDWLWHCLFPLIAYVTLLVAALGLERDPPRCLLVIGVTALVLLFIGIHNAWDAVTYIATQARHTGGPPNP